MKNLGKIFFILFLISNSLNASVVANVDSNVVTVGDTVTLNLTISGEDIEKPSLYNVCDSEIVGTSSQTSIKMVNMDYQKSYILSYQFVPTKSCEIKPIKISVSGKVETTESIKVEVKAVSKTISADYELSLVSDVDEVYVGEPFDVTLLFKQKRKAESVDSKFVAPELKGFWIKEESKATRRQDGEYITTQITYTMAAQREGVLKITPAQMRIATRANFKDMFGSWMPQVKWKSYFSNELNISVNAIPQGAKYVGEFSISASVDKNEISPNEALNVTLEVNGNGNLEDIKTFKPYIDGVNVFDEKISVIGAKLSQKMAFVADEDFIVPSFSLTFFNPKTQKVEMIQTQEIAIKVKGAKAKPELTIKRDESYEAPVVVKEVVKEGVSLLWVSIAFIAGLIIAIIIMLLKPWELFKREKPFNIKNHKSLLIKLLPYKNDVNVQEMIDILEKNIYMDAKIIIDKKELKEIVEKYEIS